MARVWKHAPHPCTHTNLHIIMRLLGLQTRAPHTLADEEHASKSRPPEFHHVCACASLGGREVPAFLCGLFSRLQANSQVHFACRYLSHTSAKPVEAEKIEAWMWRCVHFDTIDNLLDSWSLVSQLVRCWVLDLLDQSKRYVYIQSLMI